VSQKQAMQADITEWKYKLFLLQFIRIYKTHNSADKLNSEGKWGFRNVSFMRDQEMYMHN